ncbi:MAG: response regulator [Endomicrobiales bacterium]|nr:response regulator [Endomicrobiales bacterium]
MNRKAFGTYEIAKICNVTPSTVGNWIEKGLIPTFTTGGGHRRVWAMDLLNFLRQHNIPVPDKLKDIAGLDVLVVDDENQVRRLIKRALMKNFSDIVIHEAVDGFEAGQKITQLIPVLVVLDIKLPGIDGFKVCEIIRSDERLKNTKILAISGYNIDEYEKKAIESGADEFIGKPFDMEKFLEKTKKLIGNGANKST